MEVSTPPGGEHFPLAGYSLGSSRQKLLKARKRNAQRHERERSPKVFSLLHMGLQGDTIIGLWTKTTKIQ
jgi:hypothetical protein